MSQNVTVPLSDNAFRRAQQLADEDQRNIGEVIAEFLEHALPENGGPIIPSTQPDERIKREKDTYLKLYPSLKEHYSGQFVAIFNGQLVDNDHDFGQLLARIDERYPDEFVWMTRVGSEAIRTIHMRSPRFA